MKNYDFMGGTRMFEYKIMGKNKPTREQTEKFLLEIEKPIRWTHGLCFRNPTINKVLITGEEAVDKLDEYFFDIVEKEDYVHFNTLTSNDMW